MGIPSLHLVGSDLCLIGIWSTLLETLVRVNNQSQSSGLLGACFASPRRIIFFVARLLHSSFMLKVGQRVIVCHVGHKSLRLNSIFMTKKDQLHPTDSMLFSLIYIHKV
jgi:hypothetical protein